MDDKLVLNLDGKLLKSKEELHSTIQWQLGLPDYYGRNLDALWDVLSTWSTPLQIAVTNEAELKLHLAQYAENLLQLLQDAAQENAVITLKSIFPE